MRQLLPNREKRRHYERMIAAYGGACVCCGDATFEFLSLDHKNGRNTEERGNYRFYGTRFYRTLRRQGWPQEGYQLLCMNCNFSNGKYGYCPHKNQTRQENA